MAIKRLFNSGAPLVDDKGDGTFVPLTKIDGGNITNKFREAFESYDPVAGGRWTQQLASGDIITLDGNTAAASYLVISKDPLSTGVSSVDCLPKFGMPFEAAIGLHLSQRTVGQEFAIEFVSDEPPLTAPIDLAISSISQNTTTLTVNTTLPHNLRPGMRIGIRDVTDSRFNYPALVVATTPTTNQFTCTAGPAGTIPSVTAGPFTSGFVFFRSALGFAPNGTSMIFENASATNASFYIRSESGDTLPSGTIAGSHIVTTLSTASVQAVNTANSYSFQPTNEFRLSQFIDGIQWSDSIVDTLAASNNRYKRTQVVPDIAHEYKFRIRATNNASLSRPVAQIVTAVKTGTTTATITTDVPHGLTIADLIVVYGIRDQAATAFPNLLTATAVASVVDANNFTVVIGTAATVTSYGGFVAKVNGGNLMSALGANAVIAQSVVRTSNVVTVTGNATWTGVLIGDYVNLVGCRNNTDGATLGIDGAYRVRNIATTSLELEPIGSTPTGADIVSVNCGGAVIKRTDLRVSFVRVLDFERQRVELLSRPTGDISSATSVNVQNTAAVTLANTTIAGTVAVDAAIPAPVTIGLRASNANIAAMSTTGDSVAALGTMIGAQITKPFALPEAGWNSSLALTTATATAIQTAAGTGLKRHITALQAINTGTAVDLIILDGVTERWRLTLPQNVPVAFEFPTELVTTANAALNANLSAVGTVRANFQGYTAP
jgi:hypothetical protein